MTSIKIINGPNLNLLGKREPLIYGSESFESYFAELQQAFPEVDLIYVQRNDEAGMIEAIQLAEKEGCTGIVLNPAAFSHQSLAVADAVAAIGIPVVEVHISNILAREAFRQHSLVSRYAKGVVIGFGLDGYRLAITHFLRS